MHYNRALKKEGVRFLDEERTEWRILGSSKYTLSLSLRGPHFCDRQTDRQTEWRILGSRISLNGTTPRATLAVLKINPLLKESIRI